MKYRRLYLATLSLIGTIFGTSAQAGEVRIAVATWLAEPMQAIATSFQNDTGNKVILTVANTSVLVQQIIDGAPYDMLLPNNTAALKTLESHQLVVPGTSYTYAENPLVLWSPIEGYVDDSGGVLIGKQFDQLSIVSPNLVYGRPAQQVLDNLGLTSDIANKLVERHSIVQSRQFVNSSSTVLGIVNLSQVYADGKLSRGSAWVIPPSLYDPIIQQVAILEHARDNPAARSFEFYLKGSKAGAILADYGYRHDVIAGTR